MFQYLKKEDKLVMGHKLVSNCKLHMIYINLKFNKEKLTKHQIITKLQQSQQLPR